MTRFSFLGLLAAALMLAPNLAAAQGMDAPAKDGQSAAPPRVTPAELSAFVAVYGEVTQIRKKLMIEAHGMTDDAKIAALKAQAQKKIKAAIEARMTLSEYVRIGNAVNADPALHARFMQMLHPAKATAPASAGG